MICRCRRADREQPDARAPPAPPCFRQAIRESAQAGDTRARWNSSNGSRARARRPSDWGSEVSGDARHLQTPSKSELSRRAGPQPPALGRAWEDLVALSVLTHRYLMATSFEPLRKALYRWRWTGNDRVANTATPPAAGAGGESGTEDDRAPKPDIGSLRTAR